MCEHKNSCAVHDVTVGRRTVRDGNDGALEKGDDKFHRKYLFFCHHDALNHVCTGKGDESKVVDDVLTRVTSAREDVLAGS